MAAVSSLAVLSLRYPVAAALALAAVTLGFAAGIPQLETDVGYRAFLGENHPSVRELDDFLERFGGGLPMAAVWSCAETPRCESVFDPAALAMARDVSLALAAEPALGRVESPATAPLWVATPFGPLVRRFVEDGRVVRDPAALGERARIDPSWVSQLVSPDGTVGAIATQLVSSESDAAVAAYRALDRALAPFEAQGFVFHRVGGPVEFVVAGGELETATARLVPVMVLLVGAILLLIFRSLAATAAVLVSVGVAVVWTLGLLGWLSRLGWAQNSLTQILAPLVLVIGVCDGIHLLTRYALESRTEVGGRRALLERIATDVAAPCAMTSITTAAGFLSFATAALESFVRFGAIAAFGVMAAFVLAFTLLPLLLLLVDPRRLPQGRGRGRGATQAHWDRALSALLRLSESRAPLVLGVAAAVALVSVFGMARLRVDASFEELYGANSPVVRWADFVGEHLRRPDTLEIELRLPADAALADPASLAVLARTAARLEAIPELGRARSVLDLVSYGHRLLRGDDPAYQRPAERADENAALLSLLGDDVRRWVDPEGRRVRISLDSEKPPQDALRRVMRQVDAALGEELPSGWSGLATGPLAVVHDMIEDIRETQLRSFAAALAAVAVLLAIFLRSLAWALLGLVPTALPVIATLGLMGLAGLPLDVGSAMVAAVVLGIAVDDSVHLLDRIRRQDSADLSSAVREAVHHVGPALVTTSLALSLGFAALALSPWQSVASFGLVSAVAIAAALASTLIVLPALVFAAQAFARRG
ncbi:MAG: MMPL family transporter [Proteobacteria bacterium]|nr:MMPL family transporter [Pseudomonadota bacterium]